MDLTFNFFPQLNASLNAIAALFLLLGWVAIKKKSLRVHKFCMGTAFLVSSLFLASYLYYHYHFPSKKFLGEGFWRPLYFTLLISHIILATAILPFILRLLYLALKARFDEHRKMARWVWPLWIYTSVSGVLVYFFLYVWFKDGLSS
jgi:putative membrane protein